MAQAAKSKKAKAGDGSTLAAVLEQKTEKIPYEVVEEEKLPGSRVRFKLKLTEEAIKDRLKQAYKEFNNYVNLPGFRPGKAPQLLIKNRFEPAVREEAVKRLVGRLTELYAEDKKLEPISQPYLLDWSSSTEAGTTVELAFEVNPEVTITDEVLNGIAAEIHKVRIDDAFVSKSIERLREENATFEPTDTDGYESKDGMLLSCVVTDTHGVRIEERCAKDYYTTRIDEEMPAEVAKALQGKKKGDHVELDVTEDVEEGAPAGTLETVHYAVDVLEVKKRRLPEVNDDFAKDVNEKHTSVDDLKKATLEGGLAQEENRQREEALELVYHALRERLNFDLPRALVQQQAEKSFQDMERRLNQYGVSLRQMDKDIVRNYASGVEVQARVSVKNGLILKAIAKHLSVKPTEEQIGAELERAAAQTGRKALAIRAQLESRKQYDQFVSDLAFKLTNDAVLSRAALTHKEVSIEEFEALARQRQEEQAARLRGEEVAQQRQAEAEAAAFGEPGKEPAQ